MPPRFSYPFREVEIWVPVGFTGEDLTNRGGHYLWVVGRLAEGHTITDLNAELRALANRLARDSPQTNAHVGMYAVSLLDDYVGDLGTALVVLLAAVGVVLVITAANLANLLLARATGRSREMAVRAAIGAGGGRIVRQLVVENLVLAVIGALAGLVVAWASFGVLGTLVPDTLRDVSVLRIDWRVMGFAMLVAVGTGIVVGLVPARQVTRTDLVSALKQATAASRGARHPLRSALVVTEIAGAMVLVVGAALMIESFAALQRVNLGFRSDQLLTLRTPLPSGTYDAFVRARELCRARPRQGAGGSRRQVGRVHQRAPTCLEGRDDGVLSGGDGAAGSHTGLRRERSCRDPGLHRDDGHDARRRALPSTLVTRHRRRQS